MPHELLSIQIGQCGNSIGLQFWQSMSKEHGLDPVGQLAVEDRLRGIDNKNSFFHECESGRFVPRCIMLDLEPRVIQSIKNSEYRKLFDHQNMFVGLDGGGAGNNWASGYMRARKWQENLLDIVHRETEAMDLMEGVLVSHAISGGTGAGMGSFVLELLADNFSKKTVQTYSVFPTSVNLHSNKTDDEVFEGQYGDVVIEPYNSLLTLKRLACYADTVVVLDNLALHNKTSANIFLPHPSFSNINKIVSDVMTASIAPVRYPSVMFNCLSDIVLSLTPSPNLHFLMTGYTPLRSADAQVAVQHVTKTSVESVMKRLSKMRNMLVSIYHPMDKRHGYISVFNVIQGNNLRGGCGSVSRSIVQKCQYLPWVQPVYQTAFCPRSPYQVHPNHTSGLTIVNHSSIVSFFKSILNQFGKLYSRMAYIDQMQNLSSFNNLQQELEECKHCCEHLRDEYVAAFGKNYPKPDNKLPNVKSV